EEAGLAEELARQIASALRRARLVQTTRQQTVELKLLEQIGRSLSQHLNISDTIEQLVQNVHKVVPAQWASVFVRNPDTQTLETQATTFTQEGADAISIPLTAHSLTATCLREGRTI